MQYVAKAGGYVVNQWNLLNPATLSGAIDVIVIEHPDGLLHCSPWHIRFGLLQIMKPLHKKVDLYVNGAKTDLPMKLGDGGEAFFVFEADMNPELVLNSVLTLPLLAPLLEPLLPLLNFEDAETPEPLQLNLEEQIELSPTLPGVDTGPASPRSPLFEQAAEVSKKLNIPSKIDVNGDMVLDMDGYKPSSQKNIENLDELFHKIFIDEIKKLDTLEKGDYGVNVWEQIITRDKDGYIRILNQDVDPEHYPPEVGLPPPALPERVTTTNPADPGLTYFKTLRLTLDQLKHLNLNYGENTLKFKVSRGLTAEVEALLFLWKLDMPIVISDIDGTITKLDALGHIFNLVGRDWTHPGVAKLFQDIRMNGYNIVYLTARLVGQLDQTRQYLKGIAQGLTKLPPGPVILSPDRTFAALKREVILKQPEVFKMACLNDIRSLYYARDDAPDNDERTPFYAGFGNRITDAISYRSVHIPSHRIFTINPNGEVHMELLELAGLKSSYLKIGEIVDLFFPPLREMPLTMDSNWNKGQYSQFQDFKKQQAEEGPALPPGERYVPFDMDERYTQVNYWRQPIDLGELLDLSDDETKLVLPPRLPGLFSLRSGHDVAPIEDKKLVPGSPRPELLPKKLRPTLMGFALPLKSFMMFGNKDESKKENSDDEDYQYEEFRDTKQQFTMPGHFIDTLPSDEDDFTGEEDNDDDDDGDDDFHDSHEEDDYEDDDEAGPQV